MKPLLKFIILFLMSASAWGASQMYSVTSISTMLIRAKLPNAQKDTLKIQVIDVVSGKRVWIHLNPTAKPDWYESRYQIDIKGKSGELPILQFSYNDKILYVRTVSTAKIQILGLFETEKDAAPPAIVAKPVPVPSTAPTAPLPAMTPEEIKKMEALNAKTQEQERMSLEAQEALRREALLKQQNELSAAQKAAKLAKAEQLFQKASEAYSQGQYSAATSLYAEAIELDPTSDKGYYRYGVSLYKTDQYNKSLAMLSMAEGGTQSRAEHNYYVGLNHMKLKEYDKAVDQFHFVRDEEDPEISPSASFLAGQIEFQEQKYSEARKSFEYTIDKSKDPDLDRQSEDMLEKIDQIENFNASSKVKLRYTLNAGLSYDGNVLNISQQNVATDVAAYRGSYGGSLDYKFYQTYKSQWDAVASYSDIYSVDKKLAANATLQTADPLTIGLSLPYKTQINAFGKALSWNVTPSYSSLTMSVENNQRKPIIQSLTLGSDVTYQRNAVWVSTYKVEFNQDNSFLSGLSDDDQTGLRTTLGTIQTKLLDPKAQRTIVADLNLVLNQARGKNNNYQKAILGVNYSFPWKYESQSTLRAELNSVSYPDSSTTRKDLSYSLTAGASKALSKSLNLSLSLQYANNSSNVDADKYDKFLVSSMLTYSGVLLNDQPKSSP